MVGHADLVKQAMQLVDTAVDLLRQIARVVHCRNGRAKAEVERESASR